MDTSKLGNLIAGNYDQGPPVFSSQQGYFRVGQFVDLYTTGSTSPSTPLGNGGQVLLTSVAPGSSPFQFDFVGRTLSLPVGYVSLSAISGEAIITGSLAYHGMTGGTYVYSWAGGSESVTLNIFPVPEPGSMAIFAVGSIFACYGLRRRKSKPAAD